MKVLTGNMELIQVMAEDGIHNIRMNDISHLNASGAYTTIHIDGQQEHLLIGKNLGIFHAALLPFGFYRIHKSHIVNLQRIARCQMTRGGGRVEMGNGTLLPLSRSRKEEFLQVFRKMATTTV